MVLPGLEHPDDARIPATSSMASSLPPTYCTRKRRAQSCPPRPRWACSQATLLALFGGDNSPLASFLRLPEGHGPPSTPLCVELPLWPYARAMPLALPLIHLHRSSRILNH